VSLDEAIEEAVVKAVQAAFAPYLQRLADPDPLVYSIKEAAQVLATSPTTIDRLIDDGILALVPHMGQRKLILSLDLPRLRRLPAQGPSRHAVPPAPAAGHRQAMDRSYPRPTSTGICGEFRPR
jgi:hypothetical protein